MAKEPIESPYQYDFESYTDSFDTYDDLPATVSWLHSIGAAFDQKFGIKVVPGSEEWEIDHAKKEMRVGSFEDIYTRRGVLGLLLNGVGRLYLSIDFSRSRAKANALAKDHGVDIKLAKHFSAMAKTIDEIRTDSEIAKEYAGGERVVDTMHAQAYEAANKALQMMALDMRMRKEMARHLFTWMAEMIRVVKKADKEGITTKPSEGLLKDAKVVLDEWDGEAMSKVVDTILTPILNKIEKNPLITASSRTFAVLLMAAFPADIDAIAKVLVRAYDRNLTAFGGRLNYSPIMASDEKDLIKFASAIVPEIEELRLFSSHTGGHAQYVIAKAEQYYHAHRLDIPMATPFFGYDMEAKALEVEEANQAAHDISKALIANGITASITESFELTKEMLPILEPFPFLDLNDQKKQKKGNGSMSKRVAGASGQGGRKQKRDKQREKKSKSEQVKDRKRMEAINNKENQKKIDQQRGGYSILGQSNLDPLERYTYIIGPYLARIATTAAKMRRILKVNDPAGLRGAYRKGKALNSRILYRHRLDDYRLFARKEVEKDQNYGFIVMADLSGSTNSRYGNSNRQIQDEMLASAFLMAEVAERIGEKVLTSVGFFDSVADNVKRPAQYLSRAGIINEIKHHSGGTNVADSGRIIEEDLEEMQEFKVKNKTIIFITDGQFSTYEFLDIVKSAKKYQASIAYFQINENVGEGISMCKEVERFVAQNAKGVRVRTRNIPPSGINSLPEAMAQLMKETVGIVER